MDKKKFYKWYLSAVRFYKQEFCLFYQVKCIVNKKNWTERLDTLHVDRIAFKIYYQLRLLKNNFFLH